LGGCGGGGKKYWPWVAKTRNASVGHTVVTSSSLHVYLHGLNNARGVIVVIVAVARSTARSRQWGRKGDRKNGVNHNRTVEINAALYVSAAAAFVEKSARVQIVLRRNHVEKQSNHEGRSISAISFSSSKRRHPLVLIIERWLTFLATTGRYYFDVFRIHYPYDDAWN